MDDRDNTGLGLLIGFCAYLLFIVGIIILASNHSIKEGKRPMIIKYQDDTGWHVVHVTKSEILENGRRMGR